MARPNASSIHRFAREAMTTVFEVVVAGREEEYARQAARAAFDEVDRIERLFSRFDPSSEISRLNRLGAGRKMRVGLETYQCLTIAARMQAETGGAFDVNYRARANLPELLSLARIADGFEAERLARKGRRKPGVLDLDLGAIGKGYAVDSALEVLKDWGIDNVLVHAGTSTALAIGPGPAPGPRSEGWRVGVASAWKCPGSPRTIRLRDLALSGSGKEVKGEHIFDPRTGLPARGHRAAWAAHPSATVSDAASTAFLVMSTAEAEAFAAAHPDVWGVVIPGPKTCKILNSAALEARRTRRRS